TGKLPEGAIAALVDGKPVDLSRPLEADAEVRPVTFEMPEGKEVYRHSSAHIMAQAVKDLFPTAKLTIGPPIEEGFYYDFAYERNPMHQRIYGTSFPTKELLDAYLHKLEEIRKRDHRKLGRELDLIAVSDEVGPGLILWLPKGSTVRLQIENFWREQHRQHG